MRATCISNVAVTDGWEASRLSGDGTGTRSGQGNSSPWVLSYSPIRTPWEGIQPSPEIHWTKEGAPSLSSCEVQEDNISSKHPRNDQVLFQ